MISCVGDTVATDPNYRPLVAPLSGYSFTLAWTNTPAAGAPQVDVAFTTADGKATNDYKYWCRSGKAVSTPPATS